jgi:protein gp37
VDTRTDSKGRQQPAHKQPPGIVVGHLPAPRPPAKFDGVSLDEWNKLDEAAQTALLQPGLAPGEKPPRFNKQENDSIEWAMWSSNPITGCKHDCPYCYARDIAQSPQMAAAYPNGFAPTIHQRRLFAARYTAVPPEAEHDTRYRNVFLGSMADLWGGWVPDAWLDAILKMVREAPQWNFLTLTKFPKRMMDFDIPPNCWAGTTVDKQERVAAAEEAFENVGSKVKWLSCEPMLDPLRFKHLDRFDWIVIGGASRSTMTPEFQPPFEWIADLVKQARDAGTKIYMKSNLGIALKSRILELPFDAPIEANPTEAPAVFDYLGKRKQRP